jgi:O-glycosyl hydrolase
VTSPLRTPSQRWKPLAGALVLIVLAALGAVAPARLAAASTATPSTAAQRADLAQWWAPVHFQDVDATGDTSLGGKSDYLTSYDFDGDLNGRNNWENTGEYPLAAHMYYSVVQTAGFTYLVYMFFHPRDWADGSLDDYMEDLSEHENDSEGALVVVANDGTEHGALKAVITVAHKDFYSWLPAGSDFSSGAQDIDGAIATASDPHGDGHQRPWTAEQANTHAAWAMGAARKPSPDLDGQYRNGDGIMYYPSTTAEVPDSSNDRDVQYSLIDVFAPGGMWDQRNNTSLFADPNHFAGDDSGNDNGYMCGEGGPADTCEIDAASPPWAWDDGNDQPGAGYLATHPSELVHNYFNWPGKPSTADTAYTWNPYLGVTPPDPNPYRADAKTFRVNAGATSFVATQPMNSVATYTWNDGGGAPQEWLTSTNAAGNGLDRKLQPIPVAGYANPTDTIAVDPGSRRQSIDGFGAAMTDSAASLIGGDDGAMRTLFGTGDGQAGLTMIRSPMGSSDLMADGSDFHTYEDTQGSFSATARPSDTRQIAALARAKAIVGNDLKIIGTPWTAPAWAKRGRSLRPSECGAQADELDVKQVSAYAAYFRKYVDAYTSNGVRPWMVSLQNEPENCKTAMPTTLMSADDEVALARALKAQLPSDVKVMGWDHNWNDPDFVNTLTGANAVDAIGYHCYDGNHYGTQTQAVATYMTECSGWTDQVANVSQNLGWEVSNLLLGPLRYGSRGSIYWSVAQNQDGTPYLSGGDSCKTCRGLLTRYADGHVEPSQDFYFYAQFSKFVRPGAVRVESTNSGDVSTVAFHNGATTTLVVLVSGTHADGGAAGSDERNLRGHILHYADEQATQKTAWLVGADGYRRWISDIPTYDCLKSAGMAGPDEEPAGALDKYINLKDVWAVCGAYVLGTDSELEVGTYIKSGGGARLTLTPSGLRAVDSTGVSRWAPPGTGNRLILQEDQNLVLYSGNSAVWASGTVGSGAIWLGVRDDGTFALFNRDNQPVWVSPVGGRDYRRKIVNWDGDTASQKTAWLVGNDGARRWIPDLATFQCLHDTGSGDALALSSDVLDTLPDLTNVWAACGVDRIGANSAVEVNAYLKAGDYTLTLTGSDLVIARNGTKVWSAGRGGAQLKLQTDGNLVIYDAAGQATWATGTYGKSAGWLVLGSDGSLRLYDAGGKQVWTR